MNREDIQRAVAETRQVYVDLGQRPIERNCVRKTECCHFKLTGRTPYLTKGEAVVAALAFRATGRKSLLEVPDGSCPMLHAGTGNCLIYNDRPFGCRTHFCAAAGGPVARREVLDLIRRLEKIDVELGGTGPRTLANAVADALSPAAESSHSQLISCKKRSTSLDSRKGELKKKIRSKSS